MIMPLEKKLFLNYLSQKNIDRTSLTYEEFQKHFKDFCLSRYNFNPIEVYLNKNKFREFYEGITQ